MFKKIFSVSHNIKPADLKKRQTMQMLGLLLLVVVIFVLIFTYSIGGESEPELKVKSMPARLKSVPSDTVDARVIAYNRVEARIEGFENKLKDVTSENIKLKQQILIMQKGVNGVVKNTTNSIRQGMDVKNGFRTNKPPAIIKSGNNLGYNDGHNFKDTQGFDFGNKSKIA